MLSIEAAEEAEQKVLRSARAALHDLSNCTSLRIGSANVSPLGVSLVGFFPDTRLLVLLRSVASPTDVFSWAYEIWDEATIPAAAESQSGYELAARAVVDEIVEGVLGKTWRHTGTVRPITLIEVDSE